MFGCSAVVLGVNALILDGVRTEGIVALKPTDVLICHRSWREISISSNSTYVEIDSRYSSPHVGKSFQEDLYQRDVDGCARFSRNIRREGDQLPQLSTIFQPDTVSADRYMPCIAAVLLHISFDWLTPLCIEVVDVGSIEPIAQ